MFGLIAVTAALPTEVHVAMEAIDWTRRPETQAVQSVQKLPGYGLNPDLLNAINGAMPKPNGPPYIIGDTPYETLRVTGTWEWNGDVFIVGNGVLLVQGGTLILHGNIYAMGQGKFLIYDGTARYPQSFTYQWATLLSEDALMEARRSVLDYNNLPYNLLAMDNARVIWDTLTTRGWTTAGCWGRATAGLRKVNVAGEWLFTDSAIATFKDIDTMLAWFFYGQGATIDFTFPSWDNIDVFEMRDGIPGVSGIRYQVRIDTTRFCMWGTILMPGCDVTFRDSPVRTVGIMGLGADSQNLSGLVNGMTYSDFTLGMTDRSFRLLNTSVMTWSLYPAEQFILTFDHCIVGEVLSMGQALAWGQSYFLDGTGGHFEANGNSFNIAVASSMTCEIYTRENGIGLLALVGIPTAYGGIWARNTSRLILAECQFPGRPVAYDSSLIWVMGIDEPFYAPTESYVPIIGVASIIKGPLAPKGGFDHYDMYWAPAEDTTTWYPLDNPHEEPVWRDTLAIWDTHGLGFGTYLVKLVLWDDTPDSLAINDVVILNYEDTTGTVKEGHGIGKSDLLALSGPKGTTLELSLAKAGPVDLCLYDITGKRVSSLFRGFLEPGRYLFPVKAKPGVYFARLVSEGITINRNLLIR
ncbi:MAG: T9SS type A sorting domain-containing protein [candidate division WOR-3 bacterium]